ncbi:hypothetical protein [Acholeplasma hippikon]|nr:hypothetical protein [Acholeplasma hippikon]
MKKENLILVLCFVMMFVLGIVVVSIQTVLPSTPVDKMFNQKVNIVNEKTVVDSDYVNIRSHADVMSLSNEKLADLYVVTANHPTYFDLELYVAIDANGKVYAIDKKVETHDSTSASYFKLVRNYLLQNYNGLYYENVQYIDGAAGATTIGVSRSTIKAAVSQTIIYHNGEPIDHLELLFGTDAYTLTNTSTVNKITIMDVTVGGVQYKVYQHTGEGDYYDHSATHVAPITIFVALDASNDIKFVSLPEDLYGHTGGSYYTRSVNYFNSYVSTNINDELVDYTAGPTDESMGSQYLITKLLNEIKEVVS